MTRTDDSREREFDEEKTRTDDLISNRYASKKAIVVNAKQVSSTKMNKPCSQQLERRLVKWKRADRRLP